MAHEAQFTLPTSIIGPIDLGRLLRELEAVDNFLEQASVRTGGEPVQMPKTSKLLDDLLLTNKLNALQKEHRQAMLTMLRQLREHAPVIHISFSADPSPQFMQKIMSWLRTNVSPIVLVRVGLQPNIGAGCVVRTTNKYFDFSLRQFFASKHEDFLKKLHEVIVEDSNPQSSAQAQAQEVAS